MNTQKSVQNELFSDNNKKGLDDVYQIFYPGMIFVDIGAELGRYTFEVNHYLSQSSIYAIESDPSKCNQLKNNCAQWEFLSDNSIYVLEIDLYNGQKNEQNALNCYKLDTLFRKIDPDLIKINKTANELQILQDSKELLKRGKVRFLLVNNEENTLDKANSNSQVCEFMNSFGYHPKLFGEKYLFTNPKKYLSHTSKRIYRQILPETFRRWLKNSIISF